jgi:hypothetical protein
MTAQHRGCAIAAAENVCCSAFAPIGGIVSAEEGGNIMKRKPPKQRSKSGEGTIPGGGLPISPPGVFTGSIARLRIYAPQTVFAYTAPGHNDDQVGITDDPTIIHALFLARDNGRSITGATDNNGKIIWLDY